MIFESFRYWLASKIIGQPVRETKEHWRLVHTEQITLNVSGHNPEKGEVHFFFYESNLGNRRHRMECTHRFLQRVSLEEFRDRSKFYLERIIPWEAGRYDPKIASYQEVDSLDVMAKLSVG